MTTIDPKTRIERAKRVLIGLRAAIDEIEGKVAKAETEADPDFGALGTDAEGLIEMGAMLTDVLNGREYVPSAIGPRGSPTGTTTRKVRKALGYTFP